MVGGGRLAIPARTIFHERAYCSGEPEHSVRPWGVAMFNRKLEKAEWESFFNFLSKQLEGKLAEIEIASLKVGDQIEAEWLPLIGITYDPKDDIVEIALEDVDHIINKPREIYFAEEGTQFM